MKQLFTMLILGALTCVGILSAPSAQAQVPFLDMTVNPSAQTGAPGDTLFWSVLLTNNTGDTAYFVLNGFNDGLVVTPDVTVPAYDPTPFGVNYTLAPSDSLNLSSLFQTNLAPTAGNAVYTSTAELNYDLYDDNTFSNFLADGLIASNDWELTVQAPTAPAATPEPSALALFASLGLPGTLFCLRRRRRKA